MQGNNRGAPVLRALLAVAGAFAVATTGAGAAVAAAGDAFTISGNLDQTLFPGGSGSLDLSLTNVGDINVTVGEITVGITGISPQPQQQCLVADFAVTQLDDTRQFTLPANATRTLTQLGVAVADLPQVSMTNTPVNQDGCKRAVLSLRYTGMSAGEQDGTGSGSNDDDRDDDHDHDRDDDHDRDHESDGEVDGGSGGLPGTGADDSTLGLALAGLGLVAVGSGSVVLTRRMKGAQK